MAAAAARDSPDVAPVDFFFGEKNEDVAAAARESPDVAPVEFSLCVQRGKKSEANLSCPSRARPLARASTSRTAALRDLSY